MAISDDLTDLNNDIWDAYSAIEGMGGTIPQYKNTNNLVTAITSIPAGGGADPTFFGCDEGVAEMNYLENIMPEILTINYGGVKSTWL